MSTENESTIQKFQNNDKRKIRAITWYIVTFVGILVFAVIFAIALMLSFMSSDYAILGGILGFIAFLLILAVFGFSVTALVNYLMWVHRAHQNAEALSGEKLFLSPTWNVVFYFIPFANSIIPPLLMLKIAEKSTENSAKTKVMGWFVCAVILLTLSILTNVLSFSTNFISPYESYNYSSVNPGLSLAGLGLLGVFAGFIQIIVSIVGVVFFFLMINAVNKGQNEFFENHGKVKTN